MRLLPVVLRRALPVVLALSMSVPLAAGADEGFWPFNRVPRAAIEGALGVKLSDAWLGRVQRAAVRFPGGSGAFVSPEGLVLTNHHVALGALQELSTPTRDLVARGFVARDRAQELKAPNLELLSLERIDDVTARVNGAVMPGMSAAAALAARRAAIAAIEKDDTTPPGRRVEVVTLFQGAQYHRYLYRSYTDVRLVFAPEFDAAFYGGDPDNFMFPRYCLDMTIFRVYDGDRPLRSTDYLPWSAAGARAGEAVFTAGHPGATQRLNTIAHLEVARDHGLPLSLALYGRLRSAVDAYAKRGDEEARQAKDLLFSLDNSLKAWRGQLGGLQRASLLQAKREAEQRLRRAVQADATLAARFGTAWDRVQTARRALPTYNVERSLIEGGLGVFTEYFTYARTLVRWAAESPKPNGQRLPEFTDARRPQIERLIGSDPPIHPGLETARLTASLRMMRERLGASHPAVQAVLESVEPGPRAADLIGRTELGNPAVRRALFAGAPATVETSTDPFIKLARALEPRARALRQRYDDEVLAEERDAYAQIAQALFATQGDRAYPDGTFTLRLSYGRVEGYRDDGREVAPFTELRGLYVRADEHRHQPPYRIASRWMAARGQLALSTPFNLVSTNDIIGGNSGSPLVNAAGELVGLIFDGNLQSLPGVFAYEPDVNRAISVDVRAMREALRTVYSAESLLQELTGAMAGTAARKRGGAR